MNIESGKILFSSFLIKIHISQLELGTTLRISPFYFCFCSKFKKLKSFEEINLWESEVPLLPFRLSNFEINHRRPSEGIRGGWKNDGKKNNDFNESHKTTKILTPKRDIQISKTGFKKENNDLFDKKDSFVGKCNPVSRKTEVVVFVAKILVFFQWAREKTVSIIFVFCSGDLI